MFSKTNRRQERSFFRRRDPRSKENDPLQYNCSAYSDVGARENNEDAFTVAERGSDALFVVADGLGGMGSGEVASEAVVRTLKEQFENDAETFQLEEAIRTANTELLALQDKCGKKAMTTVCAVCLRGRELCLAHVGDSRIYAFGDDGILYQSVDHSVSQMAVYNGEIAADQIRGHEDRNKLTRAIGSRDAVKVDLKTVEASDIKALLLCTDGFWEKIWEDEMVSALNASPDAERWLAAMRETVESRTLDDNNTAVAVVFGD